MFQKKRPILTATYCGQLEKIRQAIEVFTGQRVSIRQMDFNTCNGKVKFGEEEKEGVFLFSGSHLLDFNLHPTENSQWVTALFEDGKAKVINQARPNKRRDGEITMRWVGYSFTDRWEEPIHLRQVKALASAQGISLQEYLGPPPIEFGDLQVGDIFTHDSGIVRCIVAEDMGRKFAVNIDGKHKGVSSWPLDNTKVRKVW